MGPTPTTAARIDPYGTPVLHHITTGPPSLSGPAHHTPERRKAQKPKPEPAAFSEDVPTGLVAGLTAAYEAGGGVGNTAGGFAPVPGSSVRRSRSASAQPYQALSCQGP